MVHEQSPSSSWPRPLEPDDSPVTRPGLDGDISRDHAITDTALLLRLGVPVDRVSAGRAAWPPGMSLARAAILMGWLDPEFHAATVAAALGHRRVEHQLSTIDGIEEQRVAAGRLTSGQPCLVLVADAAPIEVLRNLDTADRRQGLRVVVSRRTADRAWQTAHGPAVLRRAIGELARQHPNLSATAPLARWQALTIAVAIGLVLGGVVIAPAVTLALLLALMTLPFMAVVWVRLIALREALRRPASTRTGRLPDAALPTYTALVALYDEAAVLPELIAAMARIDYPPTKLEIVLVLEAADTVTRAALAQLHVPPNLRAIIVPDRPPRTKPKALNYALRFAQGDYVVVFDAEDRPDPGQLRQAAAAFATAAPDLACVQARLNIYNARDSWLSRHFTIEYSALFDAILPTLERLRLPVPLGGTSNHFPGIA